MFSTPTLNVWQRNKRESNLGPPNYKVMVRTTQPTALPNNISPIVTGAD